MHALVVDDASVMRRIHQRALQGLGWQVTLAEDGQDALKQLAAAPPCQLLLTDLHVPNLDGMELLTRVRQNASLATIKIMLVTSDGVLSVVEKAIAAGADDVLIKPFTSADFVSRLKGLVGG